MLVINMFGIPVGIEKWTLLLVALFFLDGLIYVRKQQKAIGEVVRAPVVVGLILAVVVLASIILHEMGHALVSGLYGATIKSVGFTGWGAYVELPESPIETAPIQMILVALAGPVVNFLIGGVAALYVITHRESQTENVVQYISYINLRLGRINLFPIIILDGSKVVGGVMRLFVSDPQAVMIIEIIVSVVFIAWYFILRGKKPVLEDFLERA